MTEQKATEAYSIDGAASVLDDGLGGWIDFEEKGPSRRQLCDFLYSKSPDEPLIWMLCSANLYDAMNYAGAVRYWRPAQALPRGIQEYEKPDEIEARRVYGLTRAT